MKYLHLIKRKAVLLSILCVAFLAGCDNTTPSNRTNYGYCSKMKVDGVDCVVCKFGNSVSCDWILTN